MPDGEFDGFSAAGPATPATRGGLRWRVVIGCLAAGMVAGGLFCARATGLLFMVFVGPPLLLANVTRVGHLVAPNHIGLAFVVAFTAMLYYVAGLLPLIVPASWRSEKGYKTIAVVWIGGAAAWYGVMVVVVSVLIKA